MRVPDAARALLAALAVAGCLRGEAFAAGIRVEAIAPLVEGEIAAGRIPGAVVLIGDRDSILYRRAFGQRIVRPRPLPMTVDTRFDLASLTKVVATTPAVLQLVEQGKLGLDDAVAGHWPEFGANGKEKITIRNLLTHYSGLRADLDLTLPWSGYDTAMKKIVDEKPIAPAGTTYLYSDIDFEVLGELVRRLTGQSIDGYARDRVFLPLGMKSTGYLPAADLRETAAATFDAKGLLLWGNVHDATARWMGGVAGHAGLFSTADDLAAFARMLLGGGTLGGVRVLAAGTVADMTSLQSPPHAARARGLGWDLGGPSGFSMFPEGSYGHLGFTGTLLWIDPRRGLFAIVLTNRVYPDGSGDAAPLRKGLLALLR